MHTATSSLPAGDSEGHTLTSGYFVDSATSSIVSNTFWSPPGEDRLAYVASKGSLIGITRVLAHALGGDGISVTAVAPGLTRTPGSSSVPEEDFEAVLANRRSRGP